MSEFKREERYLVVKIKGLVGMHAVKLREYLKRKGLDDHLVECVVVEAHWPIYEQTWDAVQRLAEGRPQHNAELEAERDALAAHVERLRERFSPTPWPMENQPDGSLLPVDPDEYFGTPQTSLAQRDARMKAEALDRVIMSFSQTLQDGVDIVCNEDIEALAAEYRQQAEGGE